MLSGRDSNPRATLLSFSPLAWRRLRKASAGRVLGRFRRSVDLWVGGGVVALVLPEVGNGPFHLVVDRLPHPPLPSPFTVELPGEGVRLGGWTLTLDRRSRAWNPHPPWPALRPRPAQLRELRRQARAAASTLQPSPILRWLRGEEVPRIHAFLEALDLLWKGGRGSLDPISQLAGWGPGLTPSGDDFLVGAMWGLRAAGRPELCRPMYAATEGRTTRLSRAFLEAARDGLADERWHSLLGALAGASAAEFGGAAGAVFAFGATSGLDAVAGFLAASQLTGGGLGDSCKV